MFNFRYFFPLGLATVFSRSSSSTCSRCVRLRFARWCQMANVVAVDLFFVLLRAWSASPTITTRRFSKERRLDASHMKISFTSVTLNSFRTNDARISSVLQNTTVSPISTHVGHHLLQVSQSRTLSVRSGTTSFSATTYS